MRVLLISANTLTTPYPVYPLGLDHVADAIREDHDVKIADINALKKVEPLIRLMDSFDPHVVGMSLRNIDNTDQTGPEKLYCGIPGNGPCHSEPYKGRPWCWEESGFTLFPGEMMAVLGADYGVVGEGERLADLLKAVENRVPVTGIPGIVTGNGSREIPPPLDRPYGRKHLINGPHLQYYLKKRRDAEPSDQAGLPVSVHLLHPTPILKEGS